jgi:hypothetical protein
MHILANNAQSSKLKAIVILDEAILDKYLQNIFSSRMGNHLGSLRRSDLECATVFDVGQYVKGIGPDYEKYERFITGAAFDGGYILFKFESDKDSLFKLLGIIDLAHIDFLKYHLTIISKRIHVGGCAHWLNGTNTYSTPKSSHNHFQ